MNKSTGDGQTRAVSPVILIIISAACMALTALSIDVVLPALADIRSQFSLTDPNDAQFVITAYLLGFAFGQIAFGFLSDALGRKPILIAGLLAYGLASLLCVFSPSFTILLAGRFLQGLANAAPRVFAMAILRDLHSGKRLAEMLSIVMTVFLVVPILAPAIGAGLVLAGGWELIFLSLPIFAFSLALWAGLSLPETRLEADRGAVSLAGLRQDLSRIAASTPALCSMLSAGILFASLLGYVNSVEQIYSDIYGLGHEFVLFFGLTSTSLVLASFLNSRLVRHVFPGRIVSMAILLFGLLSISLAVISWRVDPIPLWGFILAVSCCLFCLGIALPNLNTLALEPLGQVPGMASAFFSTSLIGIGALGGAAIGQLYDGTLVPMFLGFALCAFAAQGVSRLSRGMSSEPSPALMGRDGMESGRCRGH